MQQGLLGGKPFRSGIVNKLRNPLQRRVSVVGSRMLPINASVSAVYKRNPPSAPRRLQSSSTLPDNQGSPHQHVDRTPQPYRWGRRTPSEPDTSPFFRSRRSLLHPHPLRQSEGLKPMVTDQTEGRSSGRRIFTALEGSGKDAESDVPLIHHGKKAKTRPAVPPALPQDDFGRKGQPIQNARGTKGDVQPLPADAGDGRFPAQKLFLQTQPVEHGPIL